uniref:N-terminal Xaa-Pro-Lys N-methyltransferase 1 n=1 Tax=Sarcophilus harrisii TaxID=9305 RepID=A0A7N4PT44_SARHA
MTSEVVEDESQFYLKAEKYWKDVPPTVDGMLGGKVQIKQELTVLLTMELALVESPKGCSCHCSK